MSDFPLQNRNFIGIEKSNHKSREPWSMKLQSYCEIKNRLRIASEWSPSIPNLITSLLISSRQTTRTFNSKETVTL